MSPDCPDELLFESPTAGVAWRQTAEGILPTAPVRLSTEHRDHQELFLCLRQMGVAGTKADTRTLRAVAAEALLALIQRPSESRFLPVPLLAPPSALPAASAQSLLLHQGVQSAAVRALASAFFSPKDALGALTPRGVAWL